MALPLTGELPSSSRASVFRRVVLGASVAAVVAAIGLGGLVYYRNNSPHQLAIKAQLAMEQHDANRAIEFMTRALAKNPSGDSLTFDRRLMAKALIEAGREADARAYLSQVMAEKPDDAETLDLLVESHVHPAYRRFQQAFKPISAPAAEDIYASIKQELAAFAELPQSARNQVGEAELHHLYYLILGDQVHQAEAALNAAQIAQDASAIAQAQQRVSGIGEPVDAHRDKAIELLQSALKQDDKNASAGRLLAQYLYENHDYAKALGVYEQMKAKNAVAQELAITAANTMIIDTARQPERLKRFADAQKTLEGYLADHPKDSRIMVSIGQVMLEQNLISDATQMAARATAESSGDLDAQILLINCRLREKKTADALNLIQPLTNTHSNVPQVWYLLGLANSDLANYPAAEDAFRKAMSLSPTFLPARRALLTNEIRSGNTEAASGLAAQLMRDDRYYMPAWAVTVDGLNKLGQADRVRSLLINLAEDPALPAENRADLIRLLAENNAAAEAQKLLATLPPNEMETIRLKASVAAAGGDTASARVLMSQALAADPTNTALRLQFVDLLMQADRSADARGQLDQLMASKAPLTASESLTAGRDYLALRLPNQALEIAKRVTAEQPQNVEAAALMQQTQKMLAGGAGAEPAVDVHPDQATVRDTVQLAAAALDKKDYATALSLARGGLVKDATNPRLHEAAARALAGMGQLDQAVDEIAAAAGSQPDSREAFAVFVDMFGDADAAVKGIAYVGRLLSINASLGDWAAGSLAEKSGQPDLAMKYYEDGIKSVNRLTDPTAAKEALYGAVLAAEASQKDSAAIKKSADQFAKETNYSIGVRLAAAGHLLSIGDRAGAEEQLNTLTTMLDATNNPARITLAVAQNWLALGQPERARGLIEKQIAAGNKDPQLLAADASLLQQRDPDRALAIVQELTTADPTNPQYKIALAEIQGATGDYAAAFRTLDDTKALGDTGRQLATTTRLKMLIALGLLKEAADEMAAHPSPTKDDFASLLAIGQAWLQVHNPEEARKSLEAIPSYAAEYIRARIGLSDMEIDAGNPDGAVKILHELKPQTAEETGQVVGALFRATIRAGNAAEALALATKQRDLTTVGTAPYRAATLYAVAAAREARRYDDAATLLHSLDDAAQKQSALDISLIQLLQNKTADAAATADALQDVAPTYSQTTIKLLAGEANSANAKVLSSGTASAVYAALIPMTPEQQKAALGEIQKNPHVIAGDVAVLLNELGAAPETAASRLRAVAFAQRLLETGWTTTAIDLLDVLDKAGAPLTAAMIQRHQALTDIQRTADAEKVREALAAKLQQNNDVAPSVRILLAASLANKDDMAGALAMLQPLASLNRPDILTTLATFHEKLGELDQAIALHRQVRQIDPNSLLAANNLAYTLTAAKPTDKAALAEARKAIQFAIDKAPQITAFQDTLGWIEILSGQAADGTRRIARAIPSLRLDPAVHYHLGVGYSRIGQPDLARLHLQDVEILGQGKQRIAELPLAAAALKSLPAGGAN